MFTLQHDFVFPRLLLFKVFTAKTLLHMTIGFDSYLLEMVVRERFKQHTQAIERDREEVNAQSTPKLLFIRIRDLKESA